LSFIALESPKLTDILPIKLANFIVDRQFFLPFLKNLFNRRRHTQSDSSVDIVETKTTTTKKTTVVRITDIVPEMSNIQNVPVVSYLTTNSSSSEENQTNDSLNSTRPWSDEEKQLLCKAIVRFPQGTSKRWEKIADHLNRPVTQVIDMAKQIQKTVGSNVTNQFQENPLANSSKISIDQNLITERQPNEINTDWSQTDQHLLECALKTIPKDTPGVDRWEQIARCIPGKTRDECLARYRHIVQLVKAKKMA